MLGKKFIVKGLAVFTGLFLLLLSPSIVQAQDAPVPKTGQTLCYDTAGAVIDCEGTGQDGEYLTGVASPDPRFTDNGDGSVTDNLTHLIWTKDANMPGEPKAWQDALAYCEELSLGACGDNWRLPNKNELHRLLSYGTVQPALPSGHPFTNVHSDYYWSSTSIIDSTDFAWALDLGFGHVRFHTPKTDLFYVWCVCGGQ